MANMSVAEARKLGLLDEPKKKRTTRKAAPRAGAVSECASCGERFTTDAAETRHLEATAHPRYVTPDLYPEDQTRDERETRDAR